MVDPSKNHYAEMRPRLPASFIEHIEMHGEWEGDLGEEFGYIALWSEEAISDRWILYHLELYLGSRWFPIGSDGGGEMLCFDIQSGDDAVFWVPFIGTPDNDAILRYESFGNLSRAIRSL